MEMPVLVWSLKSSILSLTSFLLDETFCGVMSTAMEQSRCKDNMVAKGGGIFGPWGWPQNSSNLKKKIMIPLKSSTPIPSNFDKNNSSYFLTTISFLPSFFSGCSCHSDSFCGKVTPQKMEQTSTMVKWPLSSHSVLWNKLWFPPTNGDHSYQPHQLSSYTSSTKSVSRYPPFQMAAMEPMSSPINPHQSHTQVSCPFAPVLVT